MGLRVEQKERIENYHIFIILFFIHSTPNLQLRDGYIIKTNKRPEDRLFSFLNPLAWSIWISMVSTNYPAILNMNSKQ
jgi:hypothetical protein